MIADANFQAQWFFTLLLGFMMLAVLLCCGYMLAVVRPLRRQGEGGTALALVGATVASLVVFVSMAVTALVSLLVNH